MGRDYIEPDIIFSTTQGSVYLDTSKGDVLNASKLSDLRGNSYRYKCREDGQVEHGGIDITTFITQESASEILSWLNNDIGNYNKIIGQDLDSNNTIKTVPISFKPEEGLVPFEWTAHTPASSNIKINIDSESIEKSTVSIEPVSCTYTNGKVTKESANIKFLPGFHIGHHIQEVFKDKDYIFDAIMVNSLSNKEFSEGDIVDLYLNEINSYTYPEEDILAVKNINAEILQLKKTSISRFS